MYRLKQSAAAVATSREGQRSRRGSTALVGAGLPTISLGVIFQKMHIVVQKKMHGQNHSSLHVSQV
jgi:hypothetical protein